MPNHEKINYNTEKALRDRTRIPTLTQPQWIKPATALQLPNRKHAAKCRQTPKRRSVTALVRNAPAYACTRSGHVLVIQFQKLAVHGKGQRRSLCR